MDFLVPVRLHDAHRITAKIESEKGRAIHIAATGHSSSGTLSFAAKGVFVRVPLEHFEEFGVLTTPLETLQAELASMPLED